MRFDHPWTAKRSASFPWFRSGASLLVSFALWLPALCLVLAGAGCAPPDTPEPDDPDEESGFTLLEGSSNWSTNAVTFRDSASGLGYAMATVKVDASTDGPAFYIYQANFSLRCNPSDCWPTVHQIYVRPRLSILDLDWSPRGPLVTFEGREDGFTSRIYTLQVGGDPRPWVAGFEPVFTPQGDRIVYVENGRDAIRSFNPTVGGGISEREGLTSAANPAVSPNGRYIAYSAVDGNNGRRLFVLDRENPQFLVDTVSDPDVLPGGVDARDGTEDDFPVWSPHGKWIAYRARVVRGGIFDAIFVTKPAAEPEDIRRVAALTAGRQITGLRWHKNGEILLVVVDRDVYALTMPTAYRDP